MFTCTVRNCARCGQDHELLVFHPLANATDEWNHYGLCRTNSQPILMRFSTEEEDKHMETIKGRIQKEFPAEAANINMDSPQEVHQLAVELLDRLWRLEH